MQLPPIDQVERQYFRMTVLNKLPVCFELVEVVRGLGYII